MSRVVERVSSDVESKKHPMKVLVKLMKALLLSDNNMKQKYIYWGRVKTN